MFYGIKCQSHCISEWYDISSGQFEIFEKSYKKMGKSLRYAIYHLFTSFSNIQLYFENF